MLPEAFEQSHDVAGLSCTLGFLCAMVVKAVGAELQHGESAHGLEINSSSMADHRLR